MVMYGADTVGLRSTAQHFLASSAALRRHRAELALLLHDTGWTGPDADVSRAEWSATGSPAIERSADFVEALGRRLLHDAADQERASGGGDGHVGFRSSAGGEPVADAVASVIARAADAVDAVADAVDELAGDAVEGMRDLVGSLADRVTGWWDRPGDDAPHATTMPPADLTGLRPERFDAPTDGREALVDALVGVGDEARVRRDEIEIRGLDNGRYVVVLPGVTDLSAGFDQFARRVREEGLFGVDDGSRDAYRTWADNDEPTVRKMRYAFEAAVRDDTTENEYSTAVIAAVESAGVPTGAEVMIVGHSFGAYTAVDLAVEPTFNVAAGADEGYRVVVTHVVAAGAETDWRFDELPAGTSTLVVNNRWDAVVQAETLLHRNARPEHPTHVEIGFWGGRAGYGHDEQNYLEWLRRADDPAVVEFVAGVGSRYAAGGARVSVRVPDPALGGS